MPNQEQNQDAQWMSAASKALPIPQHAREFSSGLINDYINLVDRMRISPPKDK
jgi:hypothetical protein